MRIQRIEPSYNYKNVITLFFITASFFMFLLFLILFYINPEGSQAYVFFKKTTDYMADFYNVAKYSSDGNPYFNEFRGSYPPISYVLMMILSKFAPYKELGAFEAGKTTMGLATSAYFMFSISSLFFLLLHSFMKGTRGVRFLLVSTFYVSGIFIFTYERGNLVILSALLSTFYLFNYRSENALIRELAFLSLAFSAALKIYPALFGILLLFERRIKEALRLILYGILIALLPFLFLDHHIQNLPKLVENLSLASDYYLFMRYPRFGHYYFVSVWNSSRPLRNLISGQTLHLVLTPLVHIIAIVGIILANWNETHWKKVAILTLAVILLPVNSGLYCGIYMFPVIIMYFNQAEMNRKDWWYAILFLIFLNPIQIPVWKTNLNTVLVNISVFLLALDIIISSIKSFREKKMIRISITV